MPKGKLWNAIELQLLARAWVLTTCDPVVGKSQKASTFWNKVKHNFDLLCPDGDQEPGRFKEREVNTLKHCWSDKLQPEVNKF